MGKKVEVKFINNTGFPFKQRAGKSIEHGVWSRAEDEIPANADSVISVDTDDLSKVYGKITYELVTPEKKCVFTIVLTNGGSISDLLVISPRHATGQYWFDVSINPDIDDQGARHTVKWDQYPNSEIILEPVVPLPPKTVSAIVHKEKGDTREGCVEIRCPELSGDDNSVLSVTKEIYRYDSDNTTFGAVYSGTDSDDVSFNGVFPRQYTGPDMQYRLILNMRDDEKKVFIFRS